MCRHAGCFLFRSLQAIDHDAKGLVEYGSAQRHSGTQVANFQRITSRHESNANPREKKEK